MLDSIGPQLNRIPSVAIAVIVLVAFILLLVINFAGLMVEILRSLVTTLKSPRRELKQSITQLSPKQVEDLSNSLVGKFMTKDLLDGKEVIGLKGTLISEHIAFEAEKRGLLQKLASISAFWPVES